MVFPVAAAVGAAGALGAGVLGYFGQKSANKANLASARESMEWQERMSNTSYQRSMKDMADAGLNPILAAKFGGAGVGSGATAQSQSELGSGVSTAMEYKRLKADIDNLIEMNSKIKSETDSIKLMNKLAVIDQVNKNLSTASQVRLQNAQGDLADSNVVLNRITGSGKQTENQRLAELLKGMRLEGEIDETTFGKVMRYVSRGASVLPFVNSARRGR